MRLQLAVLSLACGAAAVPAASPADGDLVSPPRSSLPLTPASAHVGNGNKILISPAPGLPSPESLGLTPSKLYDLTIEYAAEVERRNQKAGKIQKRGACNYQSPANQHPTGRNHANACAIYLQNFGTTMCVAAAGWTATMMCQGYGLPEPITYVYGISRFSPGGSSASWRQHVAHAVFWGVNNCPNIGQSSGFESLEFAWGNGDSTVETTGWGGGQVPV
ncbi:hypothetical protein OQA88_11047 [Cercophora sp. LCS_1]